jgi:hypothetical protein
MTYKVSVSSGYNYSIKTSVPIKPKVTFGATFEIMPQNLDELTDVEISGNNDKYVLMYDAPTGKWKDRNPDLVLSAASNTETTQPGLPNDFINTLDVDLDNKIDLDAGTF